ncbi:SCO family protein [Tabrizicola sp. BL-A-41-H6]|uniref:SCO family protein n=1 Tax=Tabrizicola sp. BL-A-41-H6 TaxID=3421107 RepID=UPI003D679CB7
MTRFYAGLAAALVAAFLGVSAYLFLHNRNADAFAQCRSSQVAGGDIGGPFTLVGTDGKTVTDKEVLAKPSLVYFGYTFCPDVCPLDMGRNVEAVDILEERGFDVTPVFISIDPERDTPEALADYAGNLHPKLVALTGSLDQVKAASQAYKTYFAKQPADDEFYLVDHSTMTYLMLPGGRFADFYRRDIAADQMAESVACFLTADEAEG